MKAETFKTQFDYALCLIRSPYPADMLKGANLLVDLMARDPQRQRDYIFYLAVVHTRLTQYEQASLFADKLLLIEPNNPQIIGLRKVIHQRWKAEIASDVVTVGGTALILGSIAWIGLALLKR